MQPAAVCGPDAAAGVACPPTHHACTCSCLTFHIPPPNPQPPMHPAGTRHTVSGCLLPSTSNHGRLSPSNHAYTRSCLTFHTPSPPPCRFEAYSQRLSAALTQQPGSPVPLRSYLYSLLPHLHFTLHPPPPMSLSLSPPLQVRGIQSAAVCCADAAAGVACPS
jgi:hypothetical protein